jgi:hypothetical protein
MRVAQTESAQRNLNMSAQPARASVEDAPLLLRENVGAIAVVTFNRPPTETCARW